MDLAAQLDKGFPSQTGQLLNGDESGSPFFVIWALKSSQASVVIGLHG